MGGNYLGKGKAVESIPGRGAAPLGASGRKAPRHMKTRTASVVEYRGREEASVMVKLVRWCSSGHEGPTGRKDFYAETIDNY